jgi:uncharacterized protein (TIGR03083 family)
MSQSVLEAIAADREALLEVCSGLSQSDWGAPSGCPGWSVQDVVAHMGALFWVLVDPSTLPEVSGLPTERAAEACVEDRRSWTPDQVRDDYESVSSKALAALNGLAGEDLAVPLGDLGTYPASVIANAFAFDHFVHIRSDLFAPRGALTGAPPPVDELRVVAALDWVAAALPQQNAPALEALEALEHAVEIELTGPGARIIRLGTGEPASHVRSDAAWFLRWVTQRASWDDAGVESAGDEGDLAVTRSLRVF